MKKFIIVFLKFSLPIVLVTIGADILFKKWVNNASGYALKQNCTAIILGHSQPEGAFDDGEIENVQNFSSGGEAYIYNYQKLKKIIKENPQLKTVLISFSNNQMDEKMNEWTYGDTNLEHYFPKFCSFMDGNDYRIIAKHNFKGLLNAEVKGIICNAKSIVQKRKSAYDDRNWGGYLASKRAKLDSLISVDYIKVIQKEKGKTISEINLSYLDKMVDFCKQNKVKVILFRTPVHNDYFKIQNELLFQKIRTNRYKGIPFLDFHDFKLKNTEFGDYDHLNSLGAKKFSLFFNELIKKGIIQSQNPQKIITLEMNLKRLK